MSMKKAIAALLMSAALMPQPDGFIPDTKGTSAKKISRGMQMPRKWYQRRKKRLQMQKESRRKNRA